MGAIEPKVQASLWRLGEGKVGDRLVEENVQAHDLGLEPATIGLKTT